MGSGAVRRAIVMVRRRSSTSITFPMLARLAKFSLLTDKPMNRCRKCPNQMPIRKLTYRPFAEGQLIVRNPAFTKKKRHVVSVA